ncbi:MAG TPA: DUF362 domain-containing protein [Terriglobales bacterium]|nr:DUF362 domain-containing protein [Terriglobales bacterium]
MTNNAFQRNGKPLLIAVEGTNVRAMLKAGLSRLPLVENALQGKRVVIKPNATASEPYPVTTDLLLLQAVVQYVKRAGASQITICDSSSFASFANDRVFRKLGYFSLAKEESVRARVVDSQVGSEYVRVSTPKWRANTFLLTDRFVHEADFVINLAIPKRHHAADFSGALKNNFGCTYGTFRMLAHLRGSEFFDNSLAEFADAVRPNLTIADARSVLARSGPSFRPGQSAIVTAQRMVLSGDMVAVDSYCGRLMQKVDATFDPSRRLRHQLEYAQSLGLGESDLTRTEVVEV